MPTFFFKSRTIRIKGTIHSNDEDTTLAQLLELQAALMAGEDFLYLRADRGIKAKLFDLDTEYVEGTDKRVINCDLSMKAAIPFFYSAGMSYMAGFTISGGTYNFDVVSSGNVFTEPVISIVPTGATISDNIRLTNLTNGNEYFRFRGAVPPGVTLKVSSEDCTVLVAGVDGISTFEGNFINLVSGTNSFQYVGGGCWLEVEHKYRWTN
jgi:hypothetical protein